MTILEKSKAKEVLVTSEDGEAVFQRQMNLLRTRGFELLDEPFFAWIDESVFRCQLSRTPSPSRQMALQLVENNGAKHWQILDEETFNPIVDRFKDVKYYGELWTNHEIWVDNDSVELCFSRDEAHPSFTKPCTLHDVELRLREISRIRNAENLSEKEDCALADERDALEHRLCVANIQNPSDFKAAINQVRRHVMYDQNGGTFDAHTRRLFLLLENIENFVSRVEIQEHKPSKVRRAA